MASAVMVTAGIVLTITAVTLAVFTVLGIWYTRGRVGSVDDLLTARGTAGAGVTGATLIASGMGAWILFSPAEAGAAFGGISSVLGYALGSALPMLAFLLLAPRIRELLPRGQSITGYAGARYGATMHAYVLVVSVFYMFIFLAAEMTGIAGALALVAGVPAWQTAALVGGFVLLYTGYGGLLASLFTDTIQTLLILPLIVIGFAGAVLALGGPGAVHAGVLEASPASLDPGFGPGLQFGVFVMVAILGAEMLNQAWWQRIYAAKDTHVLRRGFTMAAVAIVPMILLAGLFGLAATGLGLVQAPADASISFFLVLDHAFPTWVTLGVVLLAVLLVMSTADTLFSAISSLVTTDAAQLTGTRSDALLQTIARVTTAIVALGAVVIGAQGWSVLTLFLVADLLAAATFIPLLAGLYSRRLGGGSALTACLAGLAGGLVYFPTLRAPLEAIPGVAGLLPAPSFLYAFLVAAGLSGSLAWLLSRIRSADVDLGGLQASLDARSGRPGPPAQPTDAAATELGGEA